MTDSTRISDRGAALTDPPSPEVPRITLKDHAKISAEIAEGEASEADVLKRHGINGQEWTQATLHWMNELAADVQNLGVESQLAIQYSDWFAAHQQNLKPASSMTPEQWEELQFDIDRAGSTDIPLARRQMSLAEYMRLVRVYAQRIAEEPEVAVRVERRRAELEGNAS